MEGMNETEVHCIHIWNSYNELLVKLFLNLPLLAYGILLLKPQLLQKSSHTPFTQIPQILNLLCLLYLSFSPESFERR
jgi:hypothetical protein